MTHRTVDSLQLRLTTRTLAALALIGCILPAAAQVTFDFTQELVGHNSDDLFGWSMDLSSDGYTVIVGAIDNEGAAVGPQPAGQARVFKNTYNEQFNSWSWLQVGADLDGTNENEEAGYSVAVTSNGSTVAVGSPNRDKTRVYDLNGQNNWVERGNGFNIYTSEDPQRAGHAVSLSGNGHILAMGAPGANKVWIADISAGSGMPMITGVPLQLSGAYAGGALDLDESGNTMVIGAYKANSNRGLVYVYERNGNNWVQRGQTLQGANNYDEFGFDVSINNDGNTIAVGIKGWDSNPNNTTYEIGQTAIYDWDGNQWVQRGTAIEGNNLFDQCGYAVSLSGDGDRVAVGYRASNIAFTGGGQVRVFDWNGTAWTQNGDPILGDDTNVFCGHSVGLSDDGVVLGIGSSQGSGPLNPFSTHEGIVSMYEGSCLGASTVQTIQSCEAFTWIDGVTYTESNSSATVTYSDVAGCDSIVSLDLTITQVDASLSQNGDVLSANNSNASYQWLDCLNSNAPIPGADEQTYLVTNTGSYAVEVTEDGCTAVSGCVSVMLLSTPTLSTTTFNLFPNPATDRIEVRSPLAVQRLELFDMSGKFLSGNSKQPNMDLYGFSHGPYFLRITFANNEVRYARITKL